MSTTTDNHVCAESRTCTCSIQALEPNEQCPVHGAGEQPPRCVTCGKFLPQEPVAAAALDPIDRVNLSAEELTPEVPVDEVAMAVDYLDQLERRVREAKKKLRDAVKQWMLATDTGEFMVGEIKWFLGTNKKEKCRDLKGALEGIYTATAGDFDQFVACLSVNAIKPGAARKVLGGDFDRFFETIIEQDVQTQQPKRELQSVNPRFIE